MKSLPGQMNGVPGFKSRIAGLVKAALPINFQEERWRRMTWPGCPACLHGREPAICTEPKWWMPPLPKGIVANLPLALTCFGDAYLDVETGDVHCSSCEAVVAFASADFTCYDCGALFFGGELWQGMSQDILEARKWIWMRSVKSRTAQEIIDCRADAKRLVKLAQAPRCGCRATLYCLDGDTDICGNCLGRWPVDSLRVVS